MVAGSEEVSGSRGWGQIPWNPGPEPLDPALLGGGVVQNPLAPGLSHPPKVGECDCPS